MFFPSPFLHLCGLSRCFFSLFFVMTQSFKISYHYLFFLFFFLFFSVEQMVFAFTRSSLLLFPDNPDHSLSVSPSGSLFSTLFHPTVAGRKAFMV